MEIVEKFWKTSSRSFNNSLRIGNLTLYYARMLQKIQKMLDDEKSEVEIICYRNIVFDYLRDLKEDEFYEEESFLSCFLDGFDESFGNVNIVVKVPKKSSYLCFDDVIILPPGIYKLLSKSDYEYCIEFVKYKKIELE